MLKSFNFIFLLSFFALNIQDVFGDGNKKYLSGIGVTRQNTFTVKVQSDIPKNIKLKPVELDEKGDELPPDLVA